MAVVCGALVAAFVGAGTAQAITIEKFVATNCKVGHEACGEKKEAETEEVVEEVGRQLEALPRKEIARQSLANSLAIVLVLPLTTSTEAPRGVSFGALGTTQASHFSGL